MDPGDFITWTILKFVIDWVVDCEQKLYPTSVSSCIKSVYKTADHITVCTVECRILPLSVLNLRVSQIRWLAVKTASEMTYTVSSGALNSTQTNQSFTNLFHCWLILSQDWLHWLSIPTIYSEILVFFCCFSLLSSFVSVWEIKQSVRYIVDACENIASYRTMLLFFVAISLQLHSDVNSSDCCTWCGQLHTFCLNWYDEVSEMCHTYIFYIYYEIRTTRYTNMFSKSKFLFWRPLANVTTVSGHMLNCTMPWHFLVQLLTAQLKKLEGAASFISAVQHQYKR